MEVRHPSRCSFPPQFLSLLTLEGLELFLYDENKDLWNLLETFLCALAVLQAKQYSLFKENNTEKQFNSMTGYMKRTSKAPESCGGWAHILWNVVEKTGEHRPQISHMWVAWEVYILPWEAVV